MRVTYKPPKLGDDWKTTVKCENGAVYGCGSILEIDINDLKIKNVHIDPDPEEAVKLWYELYVYCGTCSSKVYVYNVPLYIAKLVAERNTA